ncbi:HNH endonuclease signature motif containing protein [Micromonospora sp. WMMD1102]|uniref:HNH endonuclease n=1 Tax=Micromonospora sp. WMMD1102 TaxID=3016105 RepID=UPI0024158B3D|nr:HNH endonuclease signature motif containing protein [Micromonospora sp. WMMD1102]MDG4784937.1 HNH endonuclease signature motif containing protein [Micromonospora sp. WMMD1102]
MSLVPATVAGALSNDRYYLVAVRKLRSDLLNIALYTRFASFSARDRRWEIRQADAVGRETFDSLLVRFGHRPKVIADDPQGLAAVLSRGGFVATAIADALLREFLPSLLRPIECVRDVASFVPTFDPGHDLVGRKAPTRRQRGDVLRRDGRRCVLCGRSPANHVDLELDVHHVVPVRKAGPTVEHNLLTLCGTCHAGLGDDHDPGLRQHGYLPGPTYDVKTAPLPLMIVDNLVDGIVIDGLAVVDALTAIHCPTRRAQ